MRGFNMVADTMTESESLIKQDAACLCAANFPNQTCHSNMRDCLQQYLATGAAVYHGSNCTAMTVQNTVMVALESNTFPHPQLAPGTAPQAGTAAPRLNSVSARLLLHCTIPIHSHCCFPLLFLQLLCSPAAAASFIILALSSGILIDPPIRDSSCNVFAVSTRAKSIACSCMCPGDRCMKRRLSSTSIYCVS